MDLFERAAQWDKELREAGDRFMGKVKVKEPVMKEPEYEEEDDYEYDDEIDEED